MISLKVRMPKVMKKDTVLSSKSSQDEGVSGFTLLEKQIQAASKDGEEKIGEILGNFFELSQQLQDSAAKYSEEEFSDINTLLGSLIEQLQFYDAHSQRLAHIAKSLNYAALNKDAQKAESEALIEYLQSQYSTSEERAVHQSLLGD
ncbi:hypothetical protein IB286_03845 [Spongiibacter sp. KMU-158]|uniref:Uncharacterized protein n=1 Tax=Spongiibacter pelagi TaxID=2760804 RepID=A0A927BZW5_9GAMM|nr:hypothetical protein [Spongiibacter pelagi]MBD2858129.1 hypothetical protein [Spongiibacter pelagi]